ncbi:hypothetical protein [Nostoc sp. ChiQUE01b]|nr:hypothetical protein [Nostoc sp. ChiQUE01b]MDZ8261771.1 hypothetical protein [Nostoc sp. ChiQUE01b]
MTIVHSQINVAFSLIGVEIQAVTKTAIAVKGFIPACGISKVFIP